MSEPIQIALIASIAALLGAALTFLATSRRDSLDARLEIARFREKWIQELRAEMIDFAELASLAKHKRPDGNFDRLEGTKILKKSHKIRLMMNPNDPDYERLSLALSGKIGVLTKDELKAIPDDEYDFGFTSACQSILKREWDVVKKEILKSA